MILSLLIIFLLIFAGAVFSLFSSAMDLCRKSRLEKEQGKLYKAALKALENKTKYSLICRLWINLIKIFTAVFSGITVLTSMTEVFPDGYAAVVLVVSLLILCIIITLFGDILPRLLSRTKPEKIAATLLPLMNILSVPMIPVTLPALRFSSFFNSAFSPEVDDNSISQEKLQDELRNTLIEGEKSGIVESKERTMVEGVFYLGDRQIGAFMKHRSEIQWLDIKTPYEEIRTKAVLYREQQCFPVVNASPDEIIGAVYLEDIILDFAQNKPAGLRVIMKKAQFVPQTMTALNAFESFKHGQSNFLFVMDEYGGLAGMISIRALVEEIVGELSTPVAKEEPIILQEDGTWLADGTLNIDDAAQVLGLGGLGEEGSFHTLAGLILHLAGELPKVGDTFEHQGYSFRVLDKDGNRIDKLMISKIEQT